MSEGLFILGHATVCQEKKKYIYKVNISQVEERWLTTFENKYLFTKKIEEIKTK